jgi:ABC-type Mn2+/Zn2+ transport system ATPase subunit
VDTGLRSSSHARVEHTTVRDNLLVARGDFTDVELLLARALLVGTRVMLLDEPAEHLDADGADALGAELRHHAGIHGVAVVVVTHDDAAAAAADRVLALAGGRAHLVVPARTPDDPQVTPPCPVSAGPP